jgi:carboxylate-amine ligase
MAAAGAGAIVAGTATMRRPPARAAGGPRARVARGAARSLLTLGVEEEFVLLDAASGQAALVAPQLLELLGEPWAKQELMRFQFETTTKVCTRLDEVRGDLTSHRQAAASAAQELGCRLVASGTLPYAAPGLPGLTGTPRYRQLASRFGPLVAEAGTCACHVHVGLRSRDLAVQVLPRLRAWLAPLLAISVNSPIAHGRDTGWHSWRYRLWSRWPTAHPPGSWPDAAGYDASVARLIRNGAALDAPSVYFHARLSPRYPTVEVRIADVCLDVNDAVLLAGLVRALVATAIAEARRGLPVQSLATRRVVAALRAAAHHGLGGPGIDVLADQALIQRHLVGRLVDRVQQALEVSGDADQVQALLHRLDRHGTGAARQRALWAQARSPHEFTQALARVTREQPARPVTAPR